MSSKVLRPKLVSLTIKSYHATFRCLYRAYNSEYTLEYNTQSELFFQSRHDVEIKYIINRSNLDIESQTAKRKVSDSVIFSPPLLQDSNNGDSVITFKFSSTAFKVISISDGPKAIPAGLAARLPW